MGGKRSGGLLVGGGCPKSAGGGYPQCTAVGGECAQGTGGSSGVSGERQARAHSAVGVGKREHNLVGGLQSSWLRRGWVRQRRRGGCEAPCCHAAFARWVGECGRVRLLHPSLGAALSESLGDGGQHACAADSRTVCLARLLHCQLPCLLPVAQRRRRGGGVDFGRMDGRERGHDGRLHRSRLRSRRLPRARVVGASVSARPSLVT
mmetsp:Transcript_15265/g.38706  ORF Transcript_15265/g.38706 Transcript_15265/m.38706 type:complete len:206 (-) Transcript_15265:11-628(-)